ncbi:uncharacterized protein L969DRAFT_85037 [Mixia osmundae IAM 14324]|uniref:DNA-directed RNA polymerase II subunit RPB9 n=1 Tax=Mixia osmundae (strain CBS 9802 / IAM 14324 / JCM 22182 / KY 12970) TaxID=764103 RepID=G7DXC9_MIXOS|nr:uncharacterized protein L969DRAFT_85037 [Mixia osmundae IAM 14324]KEI41267.1 hypothetical protein L969DRAFT_85037 [Mixia osmundae IAM 14324]GAA95239.1 hypothetical protein E5Q_01895 [Mixia osmundae IAM 14324]
MASPQLLFCRNCNNLLFPRADAQRQDLLYRCKNCQHEQQSRNPCVYHHDLSLLSKQTAGQTEDLQNDPTLPKQTIKCPNPTCPSEEAVYYQDQSIGKDRGLTLFYVCIRCHGVFRDPQLDINKKAKERQARRDLGLASPDEMS